ncbi:MAG TPA: hypothetical protein QGG32_08845, partial [Rhodospirillales bacterium]|nr:hypothetical protein [Rhodospirillales bacterium]
HISHNLNILKEIFKLPNGNYARQNAFWKCHDVNSLAKTTCGIEAERLNQQIGRIRVAYINLSNAYQQSKPANDIPLK